MHPKAAREPQRSANVFVRPETPPGKYTLTVVINWITSGAQKVVVNSVEQAEPAKARTNERLG